MTSRDPRSALPGVDTLLGSVQGEALVRGVGTARATEALQWAVAEARAAIGRALDAGRTPAAPDVATLVDAAGRRLEAEERRGLRPVINATGVVLHTNLGRAPIATPAADAMVAAARGYSNLEFDLDSGARGSRYDHCVSEIRDLTGAEDALVVNNCAAGLLLAMHALARGRETVVSRGELVEIGGGFRIPEVLESAGTRLVEVGSTNRTRIEDYTGATEQGAPAVLLKVHRSNFRVTGFTSETSLEELVGLGRAAGALVVHDLGSGLILPPDRLGLPPEPRPVDSIRAGADLVIFSGDKLLGGPQAGIVAGRAEIVERLRSAPMCRALRVDKVTLAGLRATLRLLRDPERALREVPALRALATPVDVLRERAERLVEGIPRPLAPAVVETEGRVGGGTYPETPVPSAAVRLTPDMGAHAFARALRLGEHAVVGRVVDGHVLLDLRTVDPADDDLLVAALSAASNGV